MSKNMTNNDEGIMDMEDCVDERSQKGGAIKLLKDWGKKITAINKKYSKPRLKITPLVRISLLALRIYLIMLVFILIYKFYTLVR